MIAPPPNVRVWLAAGVTDMRKGFDGLAVLVQQHLGQDPFSGQLFAFRGRRGDLVKILSWDGQGLCLYAKRLEKGRFVWPQAKDGAVSLTAALLSMLLEGIDWRDCPRFRARSAWNGRRGGCRYEPGVRDGGLKTSCSGSKRSWSDANRHWTIRPCQPRSTPQPCLTT